MVCILDADKEGFLRSATSLIQTIGRSARNVNAEVVLYADTVTKSMQQAIEETQRRRTLQIEYNTASTGSPRRRSTRRSAGGSRRRSRPRPWSVRRSGATRRRRSSEEYLNELEAEMLDAAEKLEFERAAALRDRIMELKSGKDGGSARPAASAQATSARDRAKAGKGKRTQRRPKPL